MRLSAALAIVILLIVPTATAAWGTPLSASGEVFVRLVPTRSDDALLPDQSAFSGNLSLDPKDDYAPIIKAVFSEGYATNVELRMLLLDPFGGSETMTGIARDRDGFSVFSMMSTHWLWQYTPFGRDQEMELNHAKLSPLDYHDVPINRRHCPMEAALVIKIKTVWRIMLTQAHPQQSDGAVEPDAADVHFAMNDNGRLLAGVVYRNHRVKVSALESIGIGLNAWCRTGPRSAAHRELGHAVDSFLAKFGK